MLFLLLTKAGLYPTESYFSLDTLLEKYRKGSEEEPCSTSALEAYVMVQLSYLTKARCVDKQKDGEQDWEPDSFFHDVEGRATEAPGLDLFECAEVLLQLGRKVKVKGTLW